MVYCNIAAYYGADPTKSFEAGSDVVREHPKVLDPSKHQEAMDLMWTFLQWRGGLDGIPGADKDEYNHAHGHNWQNKAKELVSPLI